jgi:hypothetical protein
VRDVHFPIGAQQRAAGIDDGAGIEIQPRRGFFEDWKQNDETMLFRQFAEAIR